jgi:hypothetical protein
MTPNGLITIAALLFVGMCFTLAASMYFVALCIFAIIVASILAVLFWT